MSKMSKMPRILIVYNSALPVINGNPIVHGEFCLFAKELIDLGMKLSIWGMHSRNAEYNTHNPAGGAPLLDYCPDYFSYPLPKSYPGWMRSWVILKTLLTVCLKLWKYDFIYAFFPGRLPEIACLAAILFRKKYGLYLRGENINLPWHPLILRHAVFILTTGAVLAERAGKFCKDSHEVVPMCTAFDAPGKSVRMLPPGQVLNGLLVGRIGREKGIFELIDSLTQLWEENIDFNFTIIGSVEPEAMEYIHASPVVEKIRLTGPITDKKLLAQEYDRADLFCLPTYTEGFPRVLYEALAHGLPVLTTLVGSIGGVFKDRVNCLAFASRSSAALTEALLEFFASEELRSKLARESEMTFQQLKERFGDKSHAKQLKEKLDQHV